jgi:hypothetical protein
MNKQVIAAVLGGLVIGAAAFVPMEVAALQAAPTADNKVADNSGDTDASSVDETLNNDTEGSTGIASTGGTTPAPIVGPSFGSGDDDDEDDDEDHEDREDDEDEEDDD